MVENYNNTFKKKVAYCVGASCIAVFIISLFGVARPKLVSENCLGSCEVNFHKKLNVDQQAELTNIPVEAELVFWTSLIESTNFSFLNKFIWSKEAKLVLIRGPPKYS